MFKPNASCVHGLVYKVCAMCRAVLAYFISSAGPLSACNPPKSKGKDAKRVHQKAE